MVEITNYLRDHVVTIPALPVLGDDGLPHNDPDYNEKNEVGVYGLSAYQVERGTSRIDLRIRLSEGIPKDVTLLIIKSAHSGRSLRYIESIGRLALRVISDDYQKDLAYRRLAIDFDFTHSKAEEALNNDDRLKVLSKKCQMEEFRLRNYIESVRGMDAWTNHSGSGDDYILIFDTLLKPNKLLLYPPKAPLGKSQIHYQAGYFRPIRLFKKEEILKLLSMDSENSYMKRVLLTK